MNLRHMYILGELVALVTDNFVAEQCCTLPRAVMLILSLLVRLVDVVSTTAG